MMDAGKRVLVMVAPTGAHLSKEDVPGLPVTPEELAAEARACRQAGAAALHLHVRDHEGRHTLDFMRYGEAINAIREEVGEDMVIQITTESAGRFSPKEQMWTALALTPESVSLALRELLPEDASDELQAEVGDFFVELGEMHAGPQLICYTPEDVARAARLVEDGTIGWARPFLLFVLGRRGGADATPQMLEDYLKAFEPLRERASWMACAFGPRQLEVLEEAAMRGGHVRVGFENGAELAPGEMAESNAALVGALVECLRGRGLEPMDPAQARAFFQTITG